MIPGRHRSKVAFNAGVPDPKTFQLSFSHTTPTAKPTQHNTTR